MYQGLGTYHQQVTDRATKVWLEAWKTRTTRATAGRILAPLVDNTDDWIKLCACDYGKDELLRL